MRKLIILIIIVISLSGCQTLSLNWPETAYENGWIPPEEIPEPKPLELGPPLPKPSVPVLEVFDDDGKAIQYTVPQLMELVIRYGNTVDKFKYLVEIYERQYTSRDIEQAYLPEMTLEELKLEYFHLLGITQNSE